MDTGAGVKLTRRRFITGSTLVTLGAGASGWSWLQYRSPWRTGTILSAFEDARGDQYIGGVALASGRVFGARVPMRAHGCAVDPLHPQRVLYFARRPGTQAFELHRDADAPDDGPRRGPAAGVAFEAGAGRHLSGHGVFSRAGDLLFVPEYDYENVRGVVAVRDARDFRIVDEIDTRGIDPHELSWLPDGRRLLVANGGILTHPRSFRRKLNIDTMDPSLCVIDAASGACLEQWRLPDHRLSIRHLALAHDGSAAIGLQYEGEPAHAPGVVALYRSGGLRLLSAPAAEQRRFKGYVASVAVSEEHDLVAAACPYGGGVACWSLRQEQYLGFVEASEPYGLSRLADGRIIASQRDGTAFDVARGARAAKTVDFDSDAPIRWDDHWLAAG